MSLLPPQDLIWIGNKEDSGLFRHAENFKSAEAWALEGTPKYPLICTSSFERGSFSRSKRNVTRQNLIVFECDKADLALAEKLACKEILDDDDKRRNKELSVALIRCLQNDLSLKLVAVVDSGNKSLHAYFRYPGDAIFAELKCLLPAMGGDPMVLGSASASRLPGYQDYERKQTLLYLDNTADNSEPKLPSLLLPQPAFEQFRQKELTSLTSSSVASSLTRLPTVSSLNSSTDVVKKNQPGSPDTRTQKRFHKVAKNMPRPLGDVAYHGVAGRIVRKIEPHTEASPAALLMTLLTFTGTMIGKGAYVVTDGARQCMNLFTLIIGSSSKARKGTSLVNIERILRWVDAAFMSDNTASGLSSGEGLIAAVKDSVMQQAVNKTTGQLEVKVLEPGVDDKRLIVAEGEFANALKVAKREGNILSGILRNAWDGRDLRTMTRKDPLRSTGPHISILAHITREELLKEMSDVDTVNGFANRFLFVASQRQQLLPDGGDIGSVDFQTEIHQLTQAINRGQSAGEITRSSEAAALWRSTYEKLAKERPGLIGCITSRSEAQVTRLSALYALLDGSSVIEPMHHEAALEVWRYCEESAHWIFGMKTGQRLSDKILDALLSMAPGVMSRTEIITKVMGKNGTAQDLDSALRVLLEYELIECWEEKAVDGRVTELFRYAEGTNCTNSSTGAPSSEEVSRSKTTNSQADFVKFVDLRNQNVDTAAVTRLNTPIEKHTATSNFLFTPCMSPVNNVKLEDICEEEREHWAYYHAYGEQEANSIGTLSSRLMPK
jgi:predicted DNA-binding ribbon-helix-helix protein